MSPAASADAHPLAPPSGPARRLRSRRPACHSTADLPRQVPARNLGLRKGDVEYLRQRPVRARYQESGHGAMDTPETTYVPIPVAFAPYVSISWPRIAGRKLHIHCFPYL
jgi:hypothetical protein